MNAISARPERLADAPSTIWQNSGAKIVTPTMVPIEKNAAHVIALRVDGHR